MSQSTLNAILKEVSARYFCLIIIVSTLFAVLFLYENIVPLNYIVTICPLGHLLLFIIPWKQDYESFKPLVPVYIVYISLFLYANALFFWIFGQITAFMWFFIIPIATLVYFNRKTVIIFSIYVLVLISSIFIVVPFIPKEYFIQPSDRQLVITNIMTIILSLVFILFFISYLNKINLLKELQLRKYNSDILKLSKTNVVEEPELEFDKYEKLYFDILDLFSTKKVYCDPDFSIKQLAEEMDTNVKYIARAIKIKEDTNFSIFLNNYRIKLIKDLIAKNYQNKYTIKYIYTSAGFRHQSTFNKVFKEIEGITPSEYIKKIESKASYR